MKQFMLVLFALSFLVLTRAYQQIESVNLPVSSVFRVTDSKFSNIIDASLISDSEDASSFSNQTLFRLKRASQEDFSSMVDNLSVSARLITAISLQNGLIDQSISADKALAELLNIGSVDLEQLEKFDKAKVDGFVKSINTLTGTMTASNEQISIENMIPILDSWRKKFEEFGDLNDLKLSTDYFSEIDKLKAVQVDKDFIDPALKSIADAIPLLEKLKDLPNNTREDDSKILQIAGDLAKLNDLLKASSIILTKISELQGALTQLNTLKPLKFPIDSPQKKFIDLLKYYFLTHQPVGSADADALDAIVTSITSIIALDTSTPDIATMGAIANRDSLKLGDFTSGFLEGSSDLKKIPADSGDKWFQEVSAVEKLKSGLQPLNELDAKITVVDDSWKSLLEAQNQNSIQQVVGIHKKIISAKEGSTNFKNVVLKVAGAISKPSDTAVFTKTTKKVFDNAITLLNVLNTIPPLITTLSQLQDLSEITKLKDLITFKNPVNDRLKEVPDIIDRIKAYQKTEDLIKALKEATPILEKINNELGANDLNKILKDLGQGKAAVEAFVTDPATNRFIDFFKPFGSLVSGAEYESLRTSVKLVRGVRELKNLDLGAVTSAIEQSIPAVKDLLAFPATMKSQPELEKLKDLGKDSKAFGDSVRALDSVRNILKKKDDIEKFLKDSDAVDAKIVKVKDLSARREMLDDWGDFGSVKRQVLGLLIDLETRRDKIQAVRTKRGAPGFADYQSVFAGFQGLPDVNLDTEKMQKVLTTLGPSSQTMKDLKTSLDSLGSLNLEFASYNGPLGQIAATLANLQKTFSSKGSGGGTGGSGGSGGGSGGGQKGGGGGGGSSGPAGSSGASSGSGALTTTPASEGFWSTIGGIALIIFFVVAGIVVICLVVGCIRKRIKKSKDEKNQQKKDQKPKPTPTPTSEVKKEKSQKKEEKPKKRRKEKRKTTRTSDSTAEKMPLIDKEKKEKQATQVDPEEGGKSESKKSATFKHETVDEQKNDTEKVDAGDKHKEKDKGRPDFIIPEYEKTTENEKEEFYDPMAYKIRMRKTTYTDILDFIGRFGFSGKWFAARWVSALSLLNLWRHHYENLFDLIMKASGKVYDGERVSQQSRDLNVKCYEKDIPHTYRPGYSFYHANEINSVDAIVAQAPLLPNNGKDDTRETFWRMVLNFGTKVIVHLGEITDQYLPEEGHPLVFGELTVSAVGNPVRGMEDEIIATRIKIEYKPKGSLYAKNEEMIELSHMRIENCDENRIPTGKTRDAVKFACSASLVNRKKTVVTSATGTKLPMSFIAADYIIRKGICGNETVVVLMSELAKIRCGAFSNGQQILFAFGLALEIYDDHCEPKNKESEAREKEFKAQVKWHKDICENYKSKSGELHERAQVQLADELERLDAEKANKKTEATADGPAKGNDPEKQAFLDNCAVLRKKFADREEQERKEKEAAKVATAAKAET